MTTKDLDDFMRMKEKVQDKKTELAQNQGQLKVLRKQLNDDHSCKTVEQAKKKIKEMEDELDKKEQEIEEKASKLEDQFEWLT